jgi:hypothetical protein
MTKFNSYRRLMLSLTVVGALATACDDNDEIAVDPDAEYDVVLDVPDEQNENVNVTADQGDILAKIHFVSPEDKMKRLYITKNVGGAGEEIFTPEEQVDDKPDGSIDLANKSGKDFEFQFKLDVPSGITAGTVVYKFWTTTGVGDFRDQNKRAAVGPATITLVYGNSNTNPTAQVNTFNNITLAAPLNNGTSKTFVSVLENKDNVNGQVYTISQGVEYVSYWDFGYVYLMGGDLHATFTSTYDYRTDVVDIASIAKTTKDELNKAYFATTTMTTAQFDAVTLTTELAALEVSSASPQTISFLEANDVIAFQTAYGKKGLIKIDAVSPGNGSTGSITFDIKVQP